MTTRLYAAPATARVATVFAAAIVTLAMLSGIDLLASGEGSAQLAQAAAAQRA